MIKTVLFATDLSVFTSSTLQHAVDLAKYHRAQLVIVHAIEPLGNLGNALLHAYLTPNVIEMITTTGIDFMMKEIKSQIIDALADEYLEGDVDLLRLSEVIVRTGAPVDVILAVADDVTADLIVVGSQSPGLGILVHKVISGAKVPVYVVPNTAPIWQEQTKHKQMRLW